MYVYVYVRCVRAWGCMHACIIIIIIITLSIVILIPIIGVGGGAQQRLYDTHTRTRRSK
jgi:hypothetical protein